MTLARVLVSTVLVALACGSPPPPAAKGDEKSGPPPAKAEAKAPEGKAGPANPHAGGMISTATKPKGPPRDITPSGERRAEKAAELTFEVPKEWETQPVASPMRVAQFVVPGPGGDAEMVVFRFAGGAGGIDANIARWKGQFVAPEGKSIDEITQTSKFEAGKLAVTMVDITGHYKAAERPGSSTMIDEADYRMLAAIVEGAGDPFFFKLLGPGKTVALWAKPFEDGLRAASAGT